MVFSASSTTRSSQNGGLADSAFYLKRTLIVRRASAWSSCTSPPATACCRSATATPVFLAGSIFLLVVVLGAGSSVNGASRWIGAGSLQIQPSELAKVALVLYGADLLAREAEAGRARSRASCRILLVTGAACLLVMLQPDMGTTMVDRLRRRRHPDRRRRRARATSA